jgi:hypothetical protein
VWSLLFTRSPSRKGRKGKVICIQLIEWGTETAQIDRHWVCTEKVLPQQTPRLEAESWGYHGDDGNSFCCGARKHYGPTFSTDDVIGCGVNFRTNTAFFTKNGVSLEAAFRDINKGKLFPVVGLKKVGEHIRVNFGQDRFIFDIDHYMKVWTK